MSLDNPAGRLLAALNDATSQPENTSAHVGWCRVWNLDVDTSDGHVECMRRGSEMISLGIETRRRAEQLPSNLTAGNLARLDQVQGTLQYFVNLPQVTMGTMLSPIKPDGWLALENIDGLLSQFGPEPVILPAQSETLLDQTHQLIEKVLADDVLSEQAKRQIVNQLREVETALIEADLTGSVAIEKAGSGLAGVMFRLHLQGEKVAKHPLTQTALGLVLAIDLALNGAANYKELTADPVIRHLVENPASMLPPSQSENPETSAPDAVAKPDE